MDNWIWDVLNKTVLTCLPIYHYFYRLFSCGTSKDGESFLVEWNESEGAIKRTYNEFRKKSTGVVQFDTTQNQFLAAGEDGQIKFWDMDNINLLTSTDAEGGLQVELTFLSLLEYSLHFIRHSLYNCMNLFRPFHTWDSTKKEIFLLLLLQTMDSKFLLMLMVLDRWEQLKLQDLKHWGHQLNLL